MPPHRPARRHCRSRAGIDEHLPSSTAEDNSFFLQSLSFPVNYFTTTHHYRVIPERSLWEHLVLQIVSHGSEKKGHGIGLTLVTQKLCTHSCKAPKNLCLPEEKVSFQTNINTGYLQKNILIVCKSSCCQRVFTAFSRRQKQGIACLFFLSFRRISSRTKSFHLL